MIDLELLVAQVVILGAGQLAIEHRAHRCDHWFLGQICHDALYIHYLLPDRTILITHLPPPPDRDPGHWN